MIILEMLVELVAWLIPYLITESFTSVLVMFTVWWRVLIRDLLWIWTWDRGSNVVFDISIHNNKSIKEIAQEFNSQTIKLMNLGFEIVFITFIE